jgi:type II secretory pathway component GspD/PulD (secretin)
MRFNSLLTRKRVVTLAGMLLAVATVCIWKFCTYSVPEQKTRNTGSFFLKSLPREEFASFIDLAHALAEKDRPDSVRFDDNSGTLTVDASPEIIELITENFHHRLDALTGVQVVRRSVDGTASMR